MGSRVAFCIHRMKKTIFGTQMIICVVNRSTVYILNHFSQAVFDLGGVTGARSLKQISCLTDVLLK